MELQHFIKYNLTQEQDAFFSFIRKPDGKSHFIANANLDNKKITSLIERHRLIPFFFQHKKYLDSSLQEYVSKRFLQNSQRMLALANEIFIINKTLTANELNPIFLKGPALAYEIHNNFSSRQMVDLDIYMDKEGLNETHKQLLKLGYVPTEIPKSIFRKFILKDNYYFHPEKKVSVEIHYRFFPNKYLNTKFQDTFQVLTQEIEIQNRKLKILNTDANLLFLILHGSNHQWFRLFWLRDLADYITKKEINWQEILNSSKNLGIQNTVAQSVSLTNLFFGTQIPQAIKAISKKNKTEFFLIRKAANAISATISESFLARVRRLNYLLRMSNKFAYKFYALIGGILRFIGK